MLRYTIASMQPQPQRPPLTLRDYVQPVRKRWKLIVGLAVVITVAVVAEYAHRSVTYSASTQVYIGQQGLNQTPGGVTPDAIANQAALLTSTETAAAVAKKIGYGGGASLAGTVTATPATGANLLDISATESNPQLAVTVANAFAHEFITENASAEIRSNNQQISALKKQLARLKGSANASTRQTLAGEIQSLDAASASAVGAATQINVATSAAAHKPSLLKYGLLALLGSLIGGILFSYVLERLDPRFKTIHDAEVAYGYPVLSSVAHDPKIEQFVGDRPALSARSREAFRDLRVALDLNALGGPYKTILVTSAVPAEGKSTVSRNLALALAESERRVVLLDADLRRPRLHESLGVSSDRGLSDLLAGRHSLEDVTIGIEMAVPGLRGRRVSASDQSGLAPGFRAVPFMSFIPAGPSVPNPPAVIGSQTFQDLIVELRGRYDAVVIDSTPIVAVSDAIPIIQQVDAVVLVVRNATDARSALRASELIERVPGAKIAGLVVNDVSEAQVMAYGYGYGYGYRYRNVDEPDNDPDAGLRLRPPATVTSKTPTTIQTLAYGYGHRLP